MSPSKYVIFFLAFFTLTAFAANSIFCRMALRLHSIGALEFTIVRLLAGMLILLPILLFVRRRSPGNGRNTGSNALSVKRIPFAPALALFGYALFFSLAYIQLDASIGALILFAAVQITMVGISIYQGNRLTAIEWSGFVLAFGGLIYLLHPGLTAPPLVGAVLMLIAGMSWGVYSLMGKSEKSPIASTARNFLLCVPGCIIILMIVVLRSGHGHIELTRQGLFLALLSGGVTTALGYILWYMTLQHITNTVASIVQLAVPVIAGLGGIIFLSETLSLRMVLASFLIIGGIVVTIMGRRRIA